jgi:hypothetical protein
VTGIVTNNAKVAIGKEKESGGSKAKFDGVIIKSKSTIITMTTTTTRQPLKPVSAVPRRTTKDYFGGNTTKGFGGGC